MAFMAQPIQILYLEDNPRDEELVRAQLAAEGMDFEIVCVQTRTDYASAIDQGGWTLIISDFTLPSYDGMSALALAHTKRPDVPFIFFSGTVGEETAIEALQKGATDYVLKQRPARLVSAVKRALRETEERTERKKLEGQLRQAQKMEAIGQLTGGIAHDFNNMLTVIVGYSDLMLQKLRADDPLRSEVEQVKEAGVRASLLTRQLLAFSRKQVLQPRVLDLNAILTNMDRMLQRLIGEDIGLVTVPEPGLWRVHADPGQIEQVIMNLAVNARDAMPQGGKLTIETANVQLDDAYAREHVFVKPGPYVMLAVSDTGCGMDAETQAHIFEPFFTTKEPGKGTGLGLSTVYGIVKQSEGYVWVYSEVGRGTAFKIYLPRVEAVAEAVEPSREAARTVRGSETILLVEDDNPVRKLIHSTLHAYGYTVLEAHHGKHAIQVCEQHAGPIHLMVTDVVMPEMRGRELAERLKPSHPTMKVLFMSGYTDRGIVHHGELVQGTAFLQKPFTPDALARKVREVLDEPLRRQGV
jgi:two-component system, cell cycle sensor histidine kinase and response regulator CckA